MIVKYTKKIGNGWDLTVGEKYTVYALSIGKEGVEVFIREKGYIHFYPLDRFKIIDCTIPGNWFIKPDKVYLSDNSSYIVGYSEIIHNNDHYNQLVVDGNGIE